MRGPNGEFLPLYLYPASVVSCPPTVRDGHLTLEQEAKNRAYGCMLIVKAGRMLEVPQTTICTSQILFHRFYFRVSMSNYKLLRVAMCCLFIGCKVSETPVRLRAVCACFDRLLKRGGGFDASPLSESRFAYWSEDLASLELVILKEVGFETYVELPHSFLVHFVNFIKPTPKEIKEVEEESMMQQQLQHPGRVLTHPPAPAASASPPSDEQWHELLQRSWNTLNDALLSSRILFTFHPEVITCAAILLSSRLLHLQLPEGWSELFSAPRETVQRCAGFMCELYRMLAPYSDSHPLDYTPIPDSDTTRNNELLVYRRMSRRQRLEEKMRRMKEREQAAATATASAAGQSSSATPSSSPSSVAPSPSPSPSPMQVS